VNVSEKLGQAGIMSALFMDHMHTALEDLNIWGCMHNNVVTLVSD